MVSRFYKLCAIAEASPNIIHHADDIAVFCIARHENPSTAFLAINDVRLIGHADRREGAERELLLIGRIDEQLADLHWMRSQRCVGAYDDIENSIRFVNLADCAAA